MLRLKFRIWRLPLSRSAKLMGISLLTGSYLYFWKAQSPTIEPMVRDDRMMSERQESGRVITTVKYLWRMLRLIVIFLPSILLLPLLFWGRKVWLRVFLAAVQRAGIVWIKAFQYLSHRRDIIGNDTADAFKVLRDNAPLHSLAETQEIFGREYGMPPDKLFESFDPTPIASGSVSQVYRAKLRGKDVAVKVRHPGVEDTLELDIDLLFFFSRVASFFSAKAEVPVRTDSLKRILREQIYFLREKKNLEQFRSLPLSKMLSFPKAEEQSTDEVLIEELIVGDSIAFYERNKHALNRVIAMQGAKAFFEMLLQHNLIHADCHAGNILIRIKEDKSSWLMRKATLWAKLVFNAVMPLALVREAPVLRRLAQQNRDYERTVLREMEEARKQVGIVLIDVGMVVSLSPAKKRSFKQFLQEIIQGDADECALWIHRISQRNGVQLRDEEAPQYLLELQTMFRRVPRTALADLEGITVLQEMLGVIRSHKMQIDGEISILLTNMLVLEAVAKDLDPRINILRCAVPYLHYS